MARSGLQRNINRSARVGIAARISDDVFDRARQQRGIAEHERRVGTPNAHLPAGLARLVVGVDGHGPHDLGQIDLLGYRWSIALGAGGGGERPVLLFILVPSCSMRFRWFSASGPAFRRASSTATCSRASGDRSSFEMS